MAHLDFLKKYTFKNIMLRSEMFMIFFAISTKYSRIFGSRMQFNKWQENYTTTKEHYTHIYLLHSLRSGQPGITL